MHIVAQTISQNVKQMTYQCRKLFRYAVKTYTVNNHKTEQRCKDGCMRYDNNIGSSHKHCITLIYQTPKRKGNESVVLVMTQCTYQRSTALQYNERT